MTEPYRDPVVAQLEERNRLLAQQVASTDELAGEVTSLRGELRRRPTIDQIRRERRAAFVRFTVLTVALVLLTAYVAVWMHELYRDDCEVRPLQVGLSAPSWCNYVFPGQVGHADLDLLPAD